MRWLFYFLFFLCFANSQFAQQDATKTTTTTTIPASGSSDKKSDKKEEQAPPELGEVFKPKVAFGAGMLSFYGDLYSRHYQPPWTSRIGYDFNMSHRLNRYLQVNFNVMFGKLGADENTKSRHENFQSEIRSGGLNLMYDFGNFFSSEEVKIRPWVSAGFCAFEFLSKTDLYDKNGEKYYYWSDGSIKNMAEGSANSQHAKTLVRDYVYETDIRERNADGFGKYRESAWAFPVGFGALLQISDRFDFKIGVQYYFTTTDYIDGITDKSLGNRAGTRGKDKFVYTSFGLQYDLVVQKKADRLKGGEDETFDWLALDNEDYDKDGVRDWDDKCHGTPLGVKVDQDGCPLDDDGDGVPNYRDDENPSPKGYEVNLHGVALTDEFWQNWYDHYFDSIGIDKTTDVIGNIFAVGPKKVKVTEDLRLFTVELARYKGGVPSDEMALLLSVGDIRSTTLDDGTTVVYTAGTYDDILNAVARRDEFISEGNKMAKVGYFKSDKYSSLTDDQLQRLIREAKENGLKGNTSISGNNSGSNGNSGNAANSGNNGNANNGGNNSGNNGNNGNANNSGNNSGNSGNNGNVNNGGNNSGNNGNKGNANNSGNNSGNNGSNSGNNSGGNNAGGNTSGGNSGKSGNETFAKGDIVYRVQLGAYKNKISPGVFKGSASVIELKTEDNYYRYVTNGYKTIEQAANLRADLVVMGYTDAFVTAYRNGKRIPMSETKATMVSKEKEDLNENKAFSTIDKSLIHFRIQLGALKKPGSANDMEERVKDLPSVEKQGTASGLVRYTTGLFNDYQSAEKARKDLEDKGFPEAFIIATFKNEIISIQEAMELMK